MRYYFIFFLGSTTISFVYRNFLQQIYNSLHKLIVNAFNNDKRDRKTVVRLITNEYLILCKMLVDINSSISSYNGIRILCLSASVIIMLYCTVFDIVPTIIRITFFTFVSIMATFVAADFIGFYCFNTCSKFLLETNINLNLN